MCVRPTDRNAPVSGDPSGLRQAPPPLLGFRLAWLRLAVLMLASIRMMLSIRDSLFCSFGTEPGASAAQRLGAPPTAFDGGSQAPPAMPIDSLRARDAPGSAE